MMYITLTFAAYHYKTLFLYVAGENLWEGVKGRANQNPHGDQNNLQEKNV